MPYIKWTLLALFKPIRKILGLAWVFPVIPFRAYVRNYVYNYFLQSGRIPKRLAERSPRWAVVGWELQDIHSVGRKGFVYHRSIHKAWAWVLILLAWGFLDDDSNHDTSDAGHIKRFLEMDTWRYGQLQRDSITSWLNADPTYGNTFDLGDLRASDPEYNFWSTLVWNTRNSAYNFDYLWYQSADPRDSWLITILGMDFGWKPDGTGWHSFCCGPL